MNENEKEKKKNSKLTLWTFSRKNENKNKIIIKRLHNIFSQACEENKNYNAKIKVENLEDRLSLACEVSKLKARETAFLKPVKVESRINRNRDGVRPYSIEL